MKSRDVIESLFESRFAWHKKTTNRNDGKGGMRILFRVDADPRIGGGHVMRCLTLAGEIARRGGENAFLVNDQAQATAPALARSGLRVFVVDSSAEGAGAAARAAFPDGADWVLFDSYAFDAAFERCFRGIARRVAVIDDLADRPHDCDLLIDSTLGREAEDYRALTPAGADILAGAPYAFLRPQFAARRAASMDRHMLRTPARRVIVSMGLTDLGAVTARVCAALAQLPGNLRFDVVLGPAAPSKNAILALAKRDGRFHAHIDPPDIADLMALADIAVGAGGTSSWERCCLGLPTVLVVLADNQRLIARRLAQAGAAIPVDLDAASCGEAVAACVASLCAKPEARRAMSVAAAAIVDGGGAERVAHRIFHLANQSIIG